MSNWAATLCTLFFTGKAAASFEYAQRMLEQATIVRDNYLKGVAFYLLAFVSNWLALREGSPEERRKRHEETIANAENAVKQLEKIGQHIFIAETYLFYVDSYSNLASDLEEGPQKRAEMLEKAVQIGRKGIEHARKSGSFDALGSTFHALSKALHSYSLMKTEIDERKTLLEESLAHRREYNLVVEKAFASDHWVRGVGKYYEGLIESELALLEESGNRERLLEQASANMEQGVSYCQKAVKSRPVPTRIAAAGGFEDKLGEVLAELHSINRNADVLRRAIESHKNAAVSFTKAELPSRAAESNWKMAKIRDELGEHLEAASDFKSASEAYSTSAVKMPQLQAFFRDHASYMEAWSEIEKARASHAEQEYGKAQGHYKTAADLHKSTKSWAYFYPYYMAWSQLECGESLSRAEHFRKAIKSFLEASRLFSEAKETFGLKSGRIENEDERALIENLTTASDRKRLYCLGRISLEEARILDSEGDSLGSSKKYGTAAKVFTDIVESSPGKADRELMPIILLCLSWEKMMMAESRASPDLYAQAADLFVQAKEHAIDQRTSLFALANSSFCLALESGTKFENKREAALHIAATQQLEIAANYYLRAGFVSASEYAKATKRLFDAYSYMDAAKKEVSSERKTGYYMMAESVLAISSNSYLKAKHPERSKQMQKLITQVREERELAISLGALLKAPTVSSSTASFPTLVPNEENAVGLQTFEQANIQAIMTVRQNEVRLVEDFSLKVQVANVGKKPVLLARVENILSKNLEIVAKPEYCERENSSLSTRGRRLDPLQTEEIGLILRPFEKGTLVINPRIVCMDEKGQQIFREVEPLEIRIIEEILPDRVPTGVEELDSLLFGGIPSNYAVILLSDSCDERDLIVNSYLSRGVEKGEDTFLVSCKTGSFGTLAKGQPSRFHLFLCNPKTDTMLEDLPNVHRLRGVENLTDISIALTSVLGELEASPKEHRRACIEMVSDVLLQHQAVSTRTWLNALIPELKSKGFTIMAVMNPFMHPTTEVQAILGLFEGEIGIVEKEGIEGSERFLKIRRMYNQRYLDTELSTKKAKPHVRKTE
jgi:tetratricopeptide (TPR) repeat protein